jgi:hypothetical protein
MRAQEFILLEYRREVTLQKIGDRLQQAGARDTQQSAEEVIAALELMDPTANKEYTLWLAQNYIRGQFTLSDTVQARAALERFRAIKSRLERKDINQYSYTDLINEMNRLYNVELPNPDRKNVARPADSDSGMFPVVPGEEVLYNGVFGKLSIPRSPKASQELCTGTKWCTSDSGSYREYTKRGPLYIWRDRNGEKYQFHFPIRKGEFDDFDEVEIELRDSSNNEISLELLRQFRTEHPVLKQLFAAYESKIMKDWRKVLDYVVIYGGRVPEIEEKIKESPNVSIPYAMFFLKQRWPEAEENIITKATSRDLLDYISFFFNGQRWPEAEERIASDPKLSKVYKQNLKSARKSQRS